MQCWPKRLSVLMEKQEASTKCLIIYKSITAIKTLRPIQFIYKHSSRIHLVMHVHVHGIRAFLWKIRCRYSGAKIFLKKFPIFICQNLWWLFCFFSHWLNFFILCGKFHLFPQKILDFRPPKFLMTFFSPWLKIYNFPRYFRCFSTFPLHFGKIIIFPYYFKFAPAGTK